MFKIYEYSHKQQCTTAVHDLCKTDIAETIVGAANIEWIITTGGHICFRVLGSNNFVHIQQQMSPEFRRHIMTSDNIHILVNDTICKIFGPTAPQYNGGAQ